MVLQKYKNPRYRHKKTKKEKEKLKKAIKFKESQTLNSMIYSLPLSIKEIIFRYAIISNLHIWSLNHINIYCHTINNIYSSRDHLYKEDNKGNTWMYHIKDEIEYLNFKPKTLCNKCVNMSGQPGISDVYIYPQSIDPFLIDNKFLQIRHRMWSNITDRYWYHTKCRCKLCDMIRIKGYDTLKISDKNKFSHIKWNYNSDQWEAKSFKQVKYEKNKIRTEYRYLI